MSRLRIHVSPGALLIFALSLFFDPGGAVSALIPAAAAHELGHIAALRALGARLDGLSMDIFGLRLDYSGSLTKRRELVCAAAGPGAGLIYAGVCLALGSSFAAASGAMSLLLTGFNLLPALPLDGGRMVLAALGRAAARRASRITSLGLFAAGLGLLFALDEPAALFPGTWLLLCSLRAGT
jgi:stage IV sporulation protein FB